MTPAGLENVDTIAAMTFDWIDLIRREGMQEWLFRESGQVADIQFQFLEPGDPQSTVSSLAAKMHNYTANELLNSAFTYKDFDKNLIEDYLGYFRSDNLRMAVTAQGLPTDKIEPYYKAQYSVSPLSSELKKRFDQPRVQPSLHTPAANPFLPENLNVVSDTVSVEPAILKDEKGLKLWYLHDNTFDVPKSDILINLTSSEATKTPENAALLSLYNTMLTRSLNEYGYPAREAGMHYSLSTSQTGLSISVSGFNDKQAELLNAITSAMTTFRVDSDIFTQEKRSLIQDLKNDAFRPPFRQVFSALRESLQPRNYSTDEWLAVVDGITEKKLTDYASQFLTNSHTEAFFHGNVKQSDALAISENLVETLKTNSVDKYESSIRKLASADALRLNLDIDHNDSVLLLYYQAKDDSFQQRAKLALLGNILGTPFFNKLRTEQQLGYVAWAGAPSFEDIPGLAFLLQSPVMGPDKLKVRVDAFAANQLELLSGLTEEQLAQYKAGVTGDLLKKDANLSERTNRLWSSIGDSKHGFDERKKLAEAINATTREQLADIYSELILSDNAKPLFITNFGKAHRDEDYQKAIKGTRRPVRAPPVLTVCHRAEQTPPECTFFPGELYLFYVPLPTARKIIIGLL